MLGLSRKPGVASQHWYRILLNADQIQACAIERLRLSFGNRYTAAHMPAGMRLWLARHEDGTVKLYLSPAAEPFTGGLRAHYNAHPCGAPHLHDLTLVEGDQSGITAIPRRWLSRPITSPARRNVPVPYTFRTLRQFNTRMISAQMLFVDGQVAPYVQRFVTSWSQSAARPGRPVHR